MFYGDTSLKYLLQQTGQAKIPILKQLHYKREREKARLQLMIPCLFTKIRVQRCSSYTPYNYLNHRK